MLWIPNLMLPSSPKPVKGAASNKATPPLWHYVSSILSSLALADTDPNSFNMIKPNTVKSIKKRQYHRIYFYGFLLIVVIVLLVTCLR